MIKYHAFCFLGSYFQNNFHFVSNVIYRKDTCSNLITLPMFPNRARRLDVSGSLPSTVVGLGRRLPNSILARKGEDLFPVSAENFTQSILQSNSNIRNPRGRAKLHLYWNFLVQENLDSANVDLAHVLNIAKFHS